MKTMFALDDFALLYKAGPKQVLPSSLPKVYLVATGLQREYAFGESYEGATIIKIG